MPRRKVLRLHISLLNLEPQIWREVLVPPDLTLGNLHAVIQIVMGWEDAHLHAFWHGKQRYASYQEMQLGDEDGSESEDEHEVGELLKRRGSRLRYEYDFGDSWEHEIVRLGVEKVDEDHPLTFCVAGERAGPPEDCGGVWRYQRLIDGLRDGGTPPPDDEDWAELAEWLGGDFDPARIDLDEINARLVQGLVAMDPPDSFDQPDADVDARPLAPVVSLDEARQRGREKVGRNEPCPCGSGKKYKKCCLQKRAEPSPEQRAAALQRMDGDLARRLMSYAQRRHNHMGRFEPWFEDELGGDLDMMQLVIPCACYVFTVDGKPASEWFLAARGGKLTEAEQAWLQAQRQAWLGLWEVQEVEVGHHALLLDLLTGQRRTVIERQGTAGLVPRLVLLARVVDCQGISLLIGSHQQPLPPQRAEQVQQLVREELELGEGDVPPERLRQLDAAEALLATWHVVCEELASKPLPELKNTDGDDMLLTNDTFTIVDGERQALLERLRELKHETIRVAVEEADGEQHFTFTVAGNAKHRSWDNTVVGTAGLRSGRLNVETNSRQRADTLRALLEEQVGDLLEHRSRDHADPTALLDERLAAEPDDEEAEEALGEEELEVMRAFKQQHMEGWLDESIPLLDDATPRKAARDPALRRRLEVLVKEMECREARLPEAERFDVAGLRRELGL